MVFGLFRKKESKLASGATVMTERSTNIGGQKTAFHFEGRKDQTVVFIHGNSSCKAAFFHQYECLREAGYGVLALDLPGHGDSANAQDPETGYTIPAYAQLVRRLCDQIGVTRPLICGWSLGGHIAIEMAGSHSDYSGLMIFGTPPVGPGMEHLQSAFLPADVGDVTGAEDPPSDRLEAYIRAVYGTLDPVPDTLRAAGFRADGRSRSKMFEHWASGQSGHSQRDVVQAWRKPLIVLHGADDAFVSADYIQTLDMPGDGAGPTFQLIKDVGHAPFLEGPDAFNEILLGFCRRCFD